MNRYAVILTHDRPELLRETWCAIGPQVDMVIIIDNASVPRVDAAQLHGCDWVTVVLHIPDQPPNLSRFWNVAIRAVIDVHEAQPPGAAAGPPLVAMLCDDAPPPPGWLDAVAGAMRDTGAVVGCSDPFGYLPAGVPRVKTEPDGAIMERMPGHAWVLDPVSPVRPDESMLLWYGDTDVDWQARKAGGMVMVGGYPVPNVMPSGFMATRPELIHQTGVDGQTFAAKWGQRPW